MNKNLQSERGCPIIEKMDVIILRNLHHILCHTKIN